MSCCAACRLGAHYDIDGVADSAVLVLAKFTTTLNPSIPKPRVAFGRDPKACAAVEAMLQMVNRYDALLTVMLCCQLCFVDSDALFTECLALGQQSHL